MYNQNSLQLLPEFEAVLNNEYETMYPEMEFELQSETGAVSRKTKAYIKWIQQSLNKLLGLKLSEDGIMGSNTKAAIRAFQVKAGFKGSAVDGDVGPATEAALINAGATAPPGVHIAATPPVSACVNETDITAAFRRFLIDSQTLVNNSSLIHSGLKPRITAMIQAIIAQENMIDITAFKVVTCSKIINPLLAGMGSAAKAEIDVAILHKG